MAASIVRECYETTKSVGVIISIQYRLSLPMIIPLLARSNFTRPLLVLFAVLVATSCRRVPSAQSDESFAESIAVYEARGVVWRVDGPARKAIISHEAIAGYMEAMTMEFTAAQESDLEGMAPGDIITFRLRVGQDRSWIEACRKTGVSPAVAETLPVARQAGALTEGDVLPDCALVDEQGKARRVGEFRGQVLVLTFFFTRCPLPDYCPLLSRRFAEAERLLARSPVEGGWHLVSLSFDPDYDTPERLSAYAAQFRVTPEHWTFATGRRELVVPFAAACGVSISQTAGEIDHNLRTLVVDAEGRVRRVFTGNGWQAEELVQEMQRAAQPQR